MTAACSDPIRGRFHHPAERPPRPALGVVHQVHLNDVPGDRTPDENHLAVQSADAFAADGDILDLDPDHADNSWMSRVWSPPR